MSELKFVSCPKCQCLIWNDIPNVKDSSRTRFKCIRCGKMICLVSCKKCSKSEIWQIEKGINKKSGWRPYYRFKCKYCGRQIGVLLDIGEIILDFSF
jgi:hypothetical protein